MVKLSQREKTMIYVLALLLFFVAVFQYVLTPTVNRVLAMEEEISVKQDLEMDYRATIASAPQVTREITELEAKLETEAGDLQPVMPNEGLDELLQSYMEEYGITLEVASGSAVYGTAAMREIASYGGETAASLYAGTVSVVGAGSHDDIVEFAGHFATDPAVRMTTFAFAGSGTAFSATFDVYMY